MAIGASDAGAVSAPYEGGATFIPASHLPYECTIHTLSMRGDDGRTYDVVLDLIRSDRNPTWAITQDRMGLRAAVVDRAAGRVLASTFTDAPRAEFARDVGAMHIMDDQARIRFTSARNPGGGLREGAVDFDLTVTLRASTFVQTASEWVKGALEQWWPGRAPAGDQVARAAFPLQLSVTDYPRTAHTGTLALARGQGEPPLRLVAEGTPSTVSHHWGNALTEYVFLASVPAAGQPSFIAVVTRDLVRPDTAQPTWVMSIPVGYLIRTDERGRSRFSLLFPQVARGERDEMRLGSRLGWQLRVHPGLPVGAVTLNDGHLPTATGFAAVQLSRGKKSVPFPHVVVDVTGRFVSASA